MFRIFKFRKGREISLTFEGLFLVIVEIDAQILFNVFIYL